MSPGFCSIVVITALIIVKLFTLFDAQNAPVSPIERYQVNCRTESELHRPIYTVQLVAYDVLTTSLEHELF